MTRREKPGGPHGGRGPEREPLHSRAPLCARGQRVSRGSAQALRVPAPMVRTSEAGQVGGRFRSAGRKPPLFSEEGVSQQAKPEAGFLLSVAGCSKPANVHAEPQGQQPWSSHPL